MVSAASAWEISIKTRLGRLDGDPLLSAWSDVIADMTATETAHRRGRCDPRRPAPLGAQGSF